MGGGIYLGSEFEDLVSCVEDIAKEIVLVWDDRSMSPLAHIWLNEEREEGECLSHSFIFFPYLFCLGTQPMRW